MGLLSSIASIGKRRKARTFILRASYDAAKTHDQNRRHWANADHLSADAAGSATVRKTLRSRSRYEFENNPYARGIAHSMANYVVGQGPRLQMLTGDTEANRETERLFGLWAKAVRLPQLLRTARISQVISGEVFIQLVTNERLVDLPSIDLRLIEADQIATPFRLLGDKNIIDGVQLDDAGNIVGYTLLDAHPGDEHYSFGFRRIDPDQIIHLMRAERPGQHRGIPELASALETFAQLRRYMQAVLTAAERAAEQSMFFKTDAPPGEGPAKVAEDGTELSDLAAMEIRRNESVFLPEGWEPFQLRAEQPTAEFGATVHQYLAEIGRVLQIPAMIVTGDASNHNFASGRLDYQAFLRMIDVDRSDMETVCLDRIFAAWLAEASLMEGMLPQAARITDVAWEWHWPGIEHIDEVKAARAGQIRLESGLSSLVTEHARAGDDWEEQQRLQARALGLSIEEYRRRLADKILGNNAAADSRTRSAT